MLVLELDIPLTRRMTLNTIRNKNGDLIFTSKHASHAITWMFDNKIKEFWIEYEDKDGHRHAYLTEIKTGLIGPEAP